MLKYTLKRLLSSIPTILVVAVLIFGLVRLIPGSPARNMLGEDATEEEVLALEHKMGLDQPIVVQFGRWIGDALRGDLGDSLYYNRPVTDILLERVGPTFLLVIYAMINADRCLSGCDRGCHSRQTARQAGYDPVYRGYLHARLLAGPESGDPAGCQEPYLSLGKLHAGG